MWDFLFIVSCLGGLYLGWWGYQRWAKEGQNKAVGAFGAAATSLIVILIASALFQEKEGAAEQAKNEGLVESASDEPLQKEDANIDSPSLSLEEIQASVEKNARTIEAQGIGISQNELNEVLLDGFTVEEAVPIDGQPRRIAKGRNGLVLLETFGPERNIHKATLLFGVPNDRPAALVENTTSALLFIRAIYPSGSEPMDWFDDAIKQVGKGSVSEREMVLEGKRLKLSAFKEIGMLSLDVENASQPD